MFKEIRPLCFKEECKDLVAPEPKNMLKSKPQQEKNREISSTPNSIPQRQEKTREISKKGGPKLKAFKSKKIT